MTQFLTQITFLTLFFFVSSVPAGAIKEYDPSWNGNHVKAESEAWTWMGRFIYAENSAEDFWKKDSGFGLIHYYTRNSHKLGPLLFKTSALTRLGEEIEYDQKTTYSSENFTDFDLCLRSDRLDIRLNTQGKEDHIFSTEWREEERAPLNDLLTHYFPGLKLKSKQTPRKTIFKAEVGKKARLELSLYSLWQPIAPEGKGNMRFMGLDTYSYTDPMILATGEIIENGVARRVVGLMYLDRQWANEYFGKRVFRNPIKDTHQIGRALKFSHTWSAYHTFDPAKKEWGFFHLWQQYRRENNQPDKLVDYTGLMWMINGEKQGHLRKDEFVVKKSHFVESPERDVVINYMKDLPAFVPTRHRLVSKKPQTSFVMKLESVLEDQFLDQPIPLYEGHAMGRGVFNGSPILAQGRLESAKMLFRKQDYQNILDQLVEQNTQEDLQNRLRSLIAERENNFSDNLSLFDHFFFKIKSFFYPRTPRVDSEKSPQVSCY